jgi:ABC-2 type transport system ATP-binding protein
VIATDDPAELNLRLVSGGVRVRELTPERRTLEQVVLAATSAGSDRVDRDGERPP